MFEIFYIVANIRQGWEIQCSPVSKAIPGKVYGTCASFCFHLSIFKLICLCTSTFIGGQANMSMVRKI